MKAYSIDLRFKIIEAYEQGEESQREVAERFKVSPGFVQNLLKLYRTEKTVVPKPHTGSYPPILTEHCACVVMDNLSAHCVEGIRELIEGVGARLVYLSPYSPDFNPIENGWSKVKAFLRSAAARTRDALDQAITDALNAVTLADIQNWFTYRCYCI